MDRLQDETNKIVRKIIIENAIASLSKAYNWIGGFLGGFVFIFFYDSDENDKISAESICIGIVCFVIIWLIISLSLIVIGLASKISKQKKTDTYAYAIKSLGYAFADLHEFERQGKPNLNNIVGFFEKFCTAIKLTFDEFLTDKCNVCIKILVKNDEDKENPRIITFSRDLHSKMTREPKNKDSKHFAQDNSCFRHFYRNIGTKKGTYYLNNNLIQDSSYENSSEKFYGSLPNGCTTEQKRLENWKLPYRSELIVPIIPLNSKNLTKEILGFLCVDCDSTEIFSEDCDPYILLGTADGIYNILKKYHDKKKIK